MHIVRVATIPWEDRVNVDNWPSRAGMFYNNAQTALCIRLIDYGLGSTEPRHVHAGKHATTVLKGRATVKGETLGGWDFVYADEGDERAPMRFAQAATLLTLTMR